METLLLKYQKLFNLTNWTIDIFEDNSIDSMGEVSIIHNDFKAIIRIQKTLNDEEKELCCNP